MYSAQYLPVPPPFRPCGGYRSPCSGDSRDRRYTWRRESECISCNSSLPRGCTPEGHLRRALTLPTQTLCRYRFLGRLGPRPPEGSSSFACRDRIQRQTRRGGGGAVLCWAGPPSTLSIPQPWPPSMTPGVLPGLTNYDSKHHLANPCTACAQRRSAGMRKLHQTKSQLYFINTKAVFHRSPSYCAPLTLYIST